MNVTLDTTTLIYAFDFRYTEKRESASRIFDRLASMQAPVGLQVCGEFYRVATHKLKVSSWDAAQQSRNLISSFPIFAATPATTLRALAEAAAGRLSFWDANLLSAAEAVGCTHILSEDMGDGFRLGRLEVVNPFSGEDLSPRARALLDL